MDIRNENFLRDAVTVLFADIALFKRIVLLVCIATLCVAFFVPPVYDIGGKLLVESKQLSQAPTTVAKQPMGFSELLPATPQDLETEVNLMMSPQFVRYAAQRMLDSDTLPAPPKGLMVTVRAWISTAVGTVKSTISALTGLELEEEESGLWKDLIDSTAAEQIPGTNLIQVHFFTGSPHEDLKPAQLFMESFLLFRQNQGAATGFSFYRAKLNEYERQYADLERRKTALLQEQQLVGDVNQEVATLTEKINSLDEELIRLKDSRNTSQAWLDYMRKTSQELARQKKELSMLPPFPLAFESSDIKEVNMRLLDMIVEYLRLSSTYTENFDQSRGARQNLQSMERYILKICENEMTMRTTQLGILNKQIQDKEMLRQNHLQRVQHLKTIAPELTILNAQLASLQELIQTFIQRSEESRLQNEAGSNSSLLQMPSLRISAEATVPVHPMFPRKKIVLPLGLAAGIMLALLAVFTRHMLNRGFSKPSDVRSVLGIPTLASIEEKGTEPPSLSVLWSVSDLIPIGAMFRALTGRKAARKRKVKVKKGVDDQSA